MVFAPTSSPIARIVPYGIVPRHGRPERAAAPEAAADPAAARRRHRAWRVFEPRPHQPHGERVRPRLRVLRARLAPRQGARTHHLVAAPHETPVEGPPEEPRTLRGAIRRGRRRRRGRTAHPLGPAPEPGATKTQRTRRRHKGFFGSGTLS